MLSKLHFVERQLEARFTCFDPDAVSTPAPTSPHTKYLLLILFILQLFIFLLLPCRFSPSQSLKVRDSLK